MITKLNAFFALLISIGTLIAMMVKVLPELQIFSAEVPELFKDGRKVCVANVAGRFTNGIVVPKSWTRSDCAAYATGVTGDLDPDVVIGCVFYAPQKDYKERLSLTSLELKDGKLQPRNPNQTKPRYPLLPEPNCGWTS